MTRWVGVRLVVILPENSFDAGWKTLIMLCASRFSFSVVLDYYAQP